MRKCNDSMFRTSCWYSPQMVGLWELGWKVKVLKPKHVAMASSPAILERDLRHAKRAGSDAFPSRKHLSGLRVLCFEDFLRIKTGTVHMPVGTHIKWSWNEDCNEKLCGWPFGPPFHRYHQVNSTEIHTPWLPTWHLHCLPQLNNKLFPCTSLGRSHSCQRWR